MIDTCLSISSFLRESESGELPHPLLVDNDALWGDVAVQRAIVCVEERQRLRDLQHNKRPQITFYFHDVFRGFAKLKNLDGAHPPPSKLFFLNQ